MVKCGIVRTLIVGTVLMLLSACASGPSFSQWNAGAPALSPDKGRVFVYRESSMVAAGFQPRMNIDDVKIGAAVPGGFIFVDVAPGTHTFTSWPENLHKITFSVNAGETVYVKMILTGPNLSMMQPEPVLMEKSVGAHEVGECVYIGK
jgi:hypothetical protein